MILIVALAPAYELPSGDKPSRPSRPEPTATRPSATTADPHADVYRASGIIVLRVVDEQVSSLTRFDDKGLFAHFGLPRTIPGA